MNKYELQQEAKDALLEAIEYELESNGELPDIDDIDLTELADELVPVYTSDLIDLLRSDYGLFGWVDSDMGTIESIDQIVSWNCFNFINTYLCEIFDEVIEEVI